MAEGWARALWPGRIDARSAGVHPAGVSKRAARVMQEAGVDLSSHRSKHVSDVAGERFDYVITVCDHANEACPVVPFGGERRHRGFADPPTLALDARTEEEALVHYRRVRDEIRDWIEHLPEWLGLP